MSAAGAPTATANRRAVNSVAAAAESLPNSRTASRRERAWSGSGRLWLGVATDAGRACHVEPRRRTEKLAFCRIHQFSDAEGIELEQLVDEI